MGRASRTKRERRAEGGQGDCYESALHFLMELPTAARDGFRLCHGIVTGNAEPAIGKRFGHAWVEIGETVFDYSNGHQTLTPRVRYYQRASIDPSEVVRYGYFDAITTMLRHQHYGPWHDDKVLTAAG